MAINKTGAVFKSLTFDGENSRDYGVYITGEAVYNAPERAVEMLPIEGRNGAFALDKGRFENIEVTYPAGIFADNQTDFAKAISDFRNMLCSRVGYCRLTDEYNPDEYRLAIYKSGLEVSPSLLRAGEFNITFECKPQRYLMSGERVFHVGDWNDTDIETGDLVTVDDTAGSNGIKSLNVSFTPTQDGTPQLKDTLYKTPYLFRAVPESDDISGVLPTLVGASGVVNQLYNGTPVFNDKGITAASNSDGSVTINGTATEGGAVNMMGVSESNGKLLSNHVYLFKGCPQNGSENTFYVGVAGLCIDKGNGGLFKYTYSWGQSTFRFDFKTGATFNNVKIYPQYIDLTQFFGSNTIPDRAYALEQNQAGSGIAWLRPFGFFTKPYYAYNAGTMQSVKVSKYKSVGFNAFDKSTITANKTINAQGEVVGGVHNVSDKIKVTPSTVYYGLNVCKGADARAVCAYDGNDNFIQVVDMYINGTVNYYRTEGDFTMPLNTAYVRIITDDPDTCCFSIKYDGSRDGEYEQYNAHEYTIDDEELRGIYKYDSVHDTIYADGDVYPADGQGKHNFDYVSDMSSLTWQLRLTGSSHKLWSSTLPANYVPNYTLDNKNPWLSSKYLYIKDNNYSNIAALGVDTQSIGLYDYTSPSATNVIYCITDVNDSPSGSLIYGKLATPTDLTADSYNTPFICDNWGTEEWVDTRTVPMPVGSVERFGTFCEVRKTDELNTHVSPNLCDPDKLLNGYCYRQGDGTLMESATKVALPKLRLYGRDKIAISFDKTVQNTRVNWIVFNENGQKLYWDSQNTADSGWYISDDRVGKVLSFNYNVYPTAYAVGFYFDAAGVTVVDTLSDIMLTFTNTVVDYIAYGEDLDTDLGQDVYGGTFGLLDGTGTSDYGMVDMGSLTFTVDYNQDSVRVFGATLSDMEEATNTIMCVSGLYSDGYKQSTTSPWTGLNYMENNSIARKQDKVYVRDDGYNDVDDFKYAVSGMHLIYKKKTPAAVTFTAEAPTLAHTVNYIWNDEGTVTVEYGTDPNMIVNPTLFGCGPLIEAKGYGDITFNDYTISLANGTLGDVTLGENTDRITFNTGLLNVGDTISVKADFDASATPDSFNVSSVQSVTVDTDPSSGTPSIRTLFSGSLDVEMAVKNVIATFTAGTTDTQNFTTKFKVTYVYNGVTQVSTITLIAKIVYNATSGTIRASIGELNATNHYEAYEGTSIITKAAAVSTVSMLGNPTYIDCEIGECYKYVNNEPVGLNKYIDLGSDLPKLASGTNTFTYDNTFTKIDVVPRWWTV